MEHGCIGFAARWLTAPAAPSKQRAVGTATAPGRPGNSLTAWKERHGTFGRDSRRNSRPTVTFRESAR